MRVYLLRVASLGFLLTAFPILHASPQRAVPEDEIRAKESTARLVLQKTNSVFSLEPASSQSTSNLPATLSASFSRQTTSFSRKRLSPLPSRQPHVASN